LDGVNGAGKALLHLHHLGGEEKICFGKLAVVANRRERLAGSEDAKEKESN